MPDAREFPATECFTVDAAEAALVSGPVEAEQVVAGEPRAGVLELLTGGTVAVGVWEHSVGTSTDVEADEVFVVIAGRATVSVEGGDTLELAPGVVGVLAAGARTTWTVHEPLRKVYLTPA